MSSGLSRDTIAAIATPPGRGGIGILRLSGPEALAIAAPMLRLQGTLEPNRARFCEVLDPGAGAGSTARKLDEAIATYYAAPRSYTGEDVVEIAAHGSPVLLEFLLRALLARGARLAEPGEFTERAFLGGRLDLTQAEAVRDLIESQTLYQARLAANQLDGALSRRVAPIKASLIQLIAQLEAGIDFAEDDTPTLSAEAIATLGAPVARDLATLGRSFEHGRLIHAGFTIAIIGEPNVGKSSLFNRLVERERAIVTSSPGTTRDLVIERISIAGIPVELVDTAGLRDASGEAEQLGIAKSREALAEADVVLLVLDAERLAARDPKGSAAKPEPLPPGADLDASLAAAGRSVLVVANKCDLLEEGMLTQLRTEFKAHAFAAPAKTAFPGEPASPLYAARAEETPILVSARTGEGLDVLRGALAARLRLPEAAEQTGLITNLRQYQAVTSAQHALEAALDAATAGIPHEMLLLDLYAALRSLDTLTGETTSEDVLHLIFSTFCIGK